MGGTAIDAMIGHPDAVGTRRAWQLLGSLSSPLPGRREQALCKLAKLWFPRSSCFKPKPAHAMPTQEMLERVAACLLGDESDAVRLAALVATRAGWRAYRTVCRERMEEASPWEVPAASMGAVGHALQAESYLLRLNAARLLAEFPNGTLLPVLRLALEDPLWRVRWHAVEAITSVELDRSLVEVLRATVPRNPTARCVWAFSSAVRSLEGDGRTLPGDLARWIDLPQWPVG